MDYKKYSTQRLWEIYLEAYLKREKTRLFPKDDDASDKEYGRLSRIINEIQTEDLYNRIKYWLDDHQEEWNIECEEFIKNNKIE